MAQLLLDVYETYDKPLTHEMLFKWHSMLFKDQADQIVVGQYRTHLEPMQIVSNRLDSKRIYFEAPPSDRVLSEMTSFIDWFNKSKEDESVLGRAAKGHIYFESVHPFPKMEWENWTHFG